MIVHILCFLVYVTSLTVDASLFKEPLAVTATCDPSVLAQEIIGPNVVLLNASINGGYCEEPLVNPQCIGECRQFGTFVNGSGVTYFSLNNDVSDAVFIRRGLTISTGSVTYANEVYNNWTEDTLKESVNRDADETSVVPELESIKPDDYTIFKDVAALNIWFKAKGDQAVNISLSYIFASEEYNEYINFPDIFGLFLDGVNIADANDGSPLSAGTVNIGKEEGTLCLCLFFFFAILSFLKLITTTTRSNRSSSLHWLMW